MGYVTTGLGAHHQAAAAVYAALVGLYAAEQEAAARYLLDGLSPELAAEVRALAERDVVGELAAALRPGRTGDQARDQTATVVDGGLRAVPDRPDRETTAHPRTWDDRVAAALGTVYAVVVPEFDVAEIVDQPSYGALVRHVRVAAEEEDIEAVDVLGRLETRVLAAVERVDDPAAFLAAQVRDWIAPNI